MEGAECMNYDMVFEGGGAKGMVFVGAMQEFEARGHSHDRLLGTSAGAITAALLAAGYSSDEMLNTLAEKKGGKSVFSNFMGDPGSFSDSPLVQDGELAKLLEEIDIPLLPNAIEKHLDRAILKWIASSSKANHLFSFFAEKGSALTNRPQPPWSSYLRIQLARYLIEEGLDSFTAMEFDDQGRIINFNLNSGGLYEIINSGTPFRTTGCVDKDGKVACNRPFGSCLPDIKQWNYPYPPNKEEIDLISKNLEISFDKP